MDVIKAINERREITSFKDSTIPAEILENILEAGYLAPTGNNLPSRELTLITEKETLNQLAKTTPFMPWLEEAPAAIVVTGRPSISKYWIQDASISTGFMWLRATEVGIGVGFGAVYHHEDAEESGKREEWVRNTLNLPFNRRVVAILGLGYAKQFPKAKTLPNREEIIRYERFQ
jgi:nitroreductase